MFVETAPTIVTQIHAEDDCVVSANLGKLAQLIFGNHLLPTRSPESPADGNLTVGGPIPS